MNTINLNNLKVLLKKFLHQVISTTVVLALVLFTFSCRALYYNIPDITDHKNFPFRTIENAPDSIFYFTKSNLESTLGKDIFASNDFLSPNVVNLDTYLEDTKSAAFIVIRNDSILFV